MVYWEDFRQKIPRSTWTNLSPLKLYRNVRDIWTEFFQFHNYYQYMYSQLFLPAAGDAPVSWGSFRLLAVVFKAPNYERTYLLFCVVQNSRHKETNRRSPGMYASKTTERASGGRCLSNPYRTVRLTLRSIHSTIRSATLASSRGNTTTRCWTSPRDTCRSSQTTTATTKNGT